MAAALLFGCSSPSSPSPTQRQQAAIVTPPRITLDATPDIALPSLAAVGWVEWISPDGRSVVIELAAPVDPPSGRAWWVRDEDLKPLAALAIQPPRRGLRIGALVTQGKARVGAEVLAAERRLAPEIPPLQSGASK